MNRRATKNNRTMTTTDCSESNLFEFLFLCHAILLCCLLVLLSSPVCILFSHCRTMAGYCLGRWDLIKATKWKKKQTRRNYRFLAGVSSWRFASSREKHAFKYPNRTIGWSAETKDQILSNCNMNGKLLLPLFWRCILILSSLRIGPKYGLEWNSGFFKQLHAFSSI